MRRRMCSLWMHAPLQSTQQIGTPYKGGPRHTYACTSNKTYIPSSPTTPSTPLTQARLDDSSPMAAQLAKLNEARISLSNASMSVTDVQFCLILLNTLPASYEVMASTILASGTPSALSHTEIIAHIINEEGRRALSGSSLNAARAAPIKSSSGKKGKKDHSSLTCHYCQKKGHIKPDCRKKKQDEKKKEEGSSAGGSKLANSHVLVETSASITEVADNEISASLYATRSD